MNETEFERDLRQLINRHGIDTQARTPDHILAKYLIACLFGYAVAVAARDEWQR